MNCLFVFQSVVQEHSGESTVPPVAAADCWLHPPAGDELHEPQ